MKLKPDAQSWVENSKDTDFTIHNFPFGIASVGSGEKFACSAIGDFAINLYALHNAGYLSDLQIPNGVFNCNVLNSFIGCGKKTTNAVRNELIRLFLSTNDALKNNKSDIKEILIPLNTVQLHLPIEIRDYTDFYSSIDHATNVGKMFRDPANALLPNWKHLPVGYHGRASTICVSGHSFKRPKGQSKPADSDFPVFGASKLLDFELETAFVIGKDTEMGESVSTKAAKDYIFGMMLFNDWSARDIQTWEYVPLGPFLAKNFASTLSPWIVTLEALEPFRVSGYVQSPPVLPYLQYSGDFNIDIQLEVLLETQHLVPTSLCISNYKYMYWTMEQQLAHHTVNGCKIRVGDLMASGTISGPEPHQYGSMLELTWRGSKPMKMKDGSERKFVNDGDTISFRGKCEKDGFRLGFGSCKATVLPAN